MGKKEGKNDRHVFNTAKKCFFEAFTSPPECLLQRKAAQKPMLTGKQFAPFIEKGIATWSITRP